MSATKQDKYKLKREEQFIFRSKEPEAMDGALFHSFFSTDQLLLLSIKVNKLVSCVLNHLKPSKYLS